MLDLLLRGNAVWFGVPAIFGTAVFVVRLVLMLVGGAGLADADVDATHVPDATHPDPTGAFKALSFQSIIAFAMGFGWAGLAGLHGFKWGIGAAILLGLGGGLVMVWLLASLLRGMYELNSSGNIAPESAIGAEGRVYASIPERGGGSGQVKVIVKERQRIYNAVSQGPACPTTTRVRIVGVLDERTLTVEPV